MVHRRAALVGLAAGAATLIAIPAAFAAATTYTVKAGSKSSGTQAYTAATSKITFVDKTTGTSLGCKSGTAKGAATLGTKVAAGSIATITATTWTTCSGPGGLTLKPTQVGTWKINGNGATNSSGVTKGFVSNVKATVKASPTASLCEFTVTGAADGTYTNSTQALKLAAVSGSGHTLKVSGVSGCLGQINNGDTVTFAASYKVTTSAGALSIKSN